MPEATIGRPVSMLNSARIEMSDLCCLTQIGFASLYPFFVNCLFLAAIRMNYFACKWISFMNSHAENT